MLTSAGVIEAVSFGAGAGLPILMLHEGLGSVSMWRDFPARLAERTNRAVLAFSRRGYGQSGPFDGAYDIDFMHREADAAARVMACLGIERAHLFGHSDGASIALLLAARHPGRVASLVLEAPHVFVEPMCVKAIDALGPTADKLVERLAKHHRDAGAVFRQWVSIWTDPRFRGWSIEADIARIGCRTLIIQGDRDEYGTFEQVDRICAILPQAQQLRLPDCRHSPHRDCEPVVLNAAAAFYGEFAAK